MSSSDYHMISLTTQATRGNRKIGNQVLMFTPSLVSSPDPPENGKRVWCSERYFTWGVACKEFHNCISHLGHKLSDSLDCCTVWFTKTKTRDNHEVS